jgi:hypothetical protein
MVERNPFDPQPREPAGSEHTSGEGLRRTLRCEDWEALLADALDGLLPAADSSAFTAHSDSCATCSRLLAETKQGQEWLQFLQHEPEMPANLMERILSKTSGAVADRPLAVYGAPIPAGGPTVLGLPMRRMVWDTRLMMTAAMAFFSIALTLNLAGVRLTDLRLADLTPASLENNLTRQFYGVKGQVVRYYDNLRFVYEVESKMRELRGDEETAPPPAQPSQEKPASQTNPPPGPRKTGGKLETIPSVTKPEVFRGHPVLAGNTNPNANPFCTNPQSCSNEIESGNRDEVKTLVVLALDQAERSLA